MVERSGEALGRGHVVFVYGTLRRGGRNHILLDRGRFIGPARTLERYTLYADGVPYASKTPGPTTLRGEVYGIDAATLDALDTLEGHPDEYRREEIDVVLDAQEIGAVPQRLRAFIYFHPAPRGRRIDSGDYEDREVLP